MALEAALQFNLIKIRPFSSIDPSGSIDFAQLRSSNVELEGIGEYHSVLGWTLKRDQENVIHSASRVPVSTNSDGLRGNKEYSLEKKGERIVAIGDSFTFGECVLDNETFPAQLESLSGKSEVLNLGVFAYGHDQMLLALKEKGLKYSPDIIVVGYFPGDKVRNRFPFFIAPKPVFEMNGEDITLKGVPVQKYPGGQRELLLPRIIKNLIFLRGSRFSDSALEELTTRILEEIVVTGKAAGSKVVFVYLPDPNMLKNQDSSDRLFSDACEELDAVCLDPSEELKILPESEFKCCGHYCPGAQRVVAEYISAWLSTQ